MFSPILPTASLIVWRNGRRHRGRKRRAAPRGVGVGEPSAVRVAARARHRIGGFTIALEVGAARAEIRLAIRLDEHRRRRPHRRPRAPR